MPKTLIPTHIRPLVADTANPADDYGNILLRCPCGCTGFSLQQSVYTDEEQRAIEAYEVAAERALAWRIIRERRDENGRKMLMCRWFLFGKWEPVASRLPEAPCFMDVSAVRIRCCECGETHLIFDSRLHGFNALMGEFSGDALKWQPHWRPIGMEKDACVQISFSYEMPAEDVQKYLPDLSAMQAVDAFTKVNICAEDGVKRREIYFVTD